ncbi:MAG: hypothetical protein IT508_07225, partial [Burkholderiaceae bacterium]|nr:hypothetical protein [Burkholderiaceae bacterium]
MAAGWHDGVGFFECRTVGRGVSIMTEQLDLFVIGGGSGGVRAARIAAGHGA